MREVSISRGQLIVFTGIDGSGKTTQAKLLIENLKQNGIEAFYVWNRWEPSLNLLIKLWKNMITRDISKSNIKGKKIKDKKYKLLSNPIFRWIWLIFFFIDYGMQTFVRSRILLLRKRLVISDRIFYDSIIDQAINLGERKDSLIDSLNSFWIKLFFPSPDMVIYVDCPEDIAFSRKQGDQDIGYLKDRRQLYLKLATKYRWIKIDGTLPINEIAVQINDKVLNTIAH